MDEGAVYLKAIQPAETGSPGEPVLNPLFNDRPPLLDLQREKPEHLMMVMLKAQGLSDREISLRFNDRYGAEYVGTVLRQPWARQRLLDLLNSAGRSGIETLLKSAVEDSVFRLIEERDNPKARPAERINAANSILDRYFGKPTQHVNQHQVNYTVDDIQKLEQDERMVEAELQRLEGSNN